MGTKTAVRIMREVERQNRRERKLRREVEELRQDIEGITQSLDKLFEMVYHLNVYVTK